MVGELKGDEAGMVDYKAMHYSLENEKLLKVFSTKPTCLDNMFYKGDSEAFTWKIHLRRITHSPDDAPKMKCHLTKFVPIAGKEFSFVLAT